MADQPETPIVLTHSGLNNATYEVANEDQVEILAKSGWKRAPKSEQPKPPAA